MFSSYLSLNPSAIPFCPEFLIPPSPIRRDTIQDLWNLDTYGPKRSKNAPVKNNNSGKIRSIFWDRDTYGPPNKKKKIIHTNWVTERYVTNWLLIPLDKSRWGDEAVMSEDWV